MSLNKNNKSDYESLASLKNNGSKKNSDHATLKPPGKSKQTNRISNFSEDNTPLDLKQNNTKKVISHHLANGEKELNNAENFVLKSKGSSVEKEVQNAESLDRREGERVESDFNSSEVNANGIALEENYAEGLKRRKRKKKAEKDFKILNNESWVARSGHFLTYIGLYCFSVMVYFRPYELVPGLEFLSTTAFFLALATLLVYLPTQLSTEGSFTTFSTEVKCIFVIVGLAILTMPISKDFGMAWKEFNDSFIKAIVMFIVMVNVVRTRRRLMGLLWMSMLAGVVLSYMALGMYMRGEMSVEGYRVGVDIGGMFGNPNELALHLVLMLPIAVALGIATKNKLLKLLYFAMAGMFIAANVITYSRGGFLGMVAIAIFMIWKLGKEQKIKIYAISFVLFILFILLVPGEYGTRVFSIFDSTLDAVGSSNQRTELLKRSIIVSLRNPWGIGIGNFSIVGVQNLGTHNAFTQVSSELGITALIAYLIFLISPYRKLGAIERRLPEKTETRWFRYLAIGLQASIIGFCISGFFAAVAYNWFAYYLIAYAVAFRRIYLIETDLKEEDVKADSLTESLFGWQVKST